MADRLLVLCNYNGGLFSKDVVVVQPTAEYHDFMRVRFVVLALVLAGGLAAAADKHPKPAKAPKHAVNTPKAANHSKEGRQAVVHKAPKLARHKTSTPKVAKRKPTKFQKHKA